MSTQIDDDDTEEPAEIDLISEDPQVLFDTAIRSLAKQGRLSRQPPLSNTEDGSCLYEDGGRRCAIGWVMTPDALNKFGDLIDNVEHLHKDHSFNSGSVGLPFLTALQDVHDGSSSRENFKELALEFSKTYQLSSKVAEELLTPEWCANPTWEP